MFLPSVCVRAQRSLGSIVEPRSARAGDAPDQELLAGAPDPAQPAVLRPLCQLMQRAAEARTGQPAGAFHVSSHQWQYIQKGKERTYWMQNSCCSLFLTIIFFFFHCTQ